MNLERHLYGDSFFQIETRNPGFSDKRNRKKNLVSIIYSFLLNFLS